MSIARFYLSPIPSEDFASLPSDEASHAKVLRIKLYDSISIFDGIGNEAVCQVIEVDKRGLAFRILQRNYSPRCLPGRVVLGVSMPKGDRQRAVIEKAVELGVHDLIPIQTSRSVADVNDRGIARAERIVIESCKQCGRNQLMNVHSAVTFAEFLVAPEANTNVAKWIAHPILDSSHGLAALASNYDKYWLCVGPEGGFSEDELQNAARHQWQILALGDRILRVETAVTSAVSLVGFLLDPPQIISPTA